MAAEVAFVGHDPKPRRLGAVLNMIAGAAVTKGMVVAFDATGESFEVHPHIGATTSGPIGVALHSQATVGGKVAVASIGSIVKVQNGYDTALEAGTQIIGSSAQAGTVLSYVSTTGGEEPVGYLLEALTGDATPAYAYITGSVKLSKK